MADLEELRIKVTALGERVKELKASGTASAEAITAAVAELLEAKKEFASQNNGIGVDGKPLGDEGKSKNKTKSTTSTDAADGAPPKSKEVADPNSANALKKAAKKAEAKAKKEAAKETASPGQDKSPESEPVEQATATTPTAAPKAPPLKAIVSSQPSTVSSIGSTTKPNMTSASISSSSTSWSSSYSITKSKLQPMQLSFNPNVPITDRPVTALTVAVLTNTIIDVTIVSDHTRMTGPALGLPQGGEILGDLAIARFLTRRPLAIRFGGKGLLGDTKDETTASSGLAMVDMWLDYVLRISSYPIQERIPAILATIDHHLAATNQTYMVGYSITMADIALFAALGFPSQIQGLEQILSIIDSHTRPTYRWVKMMSTLPAIREATQLAVGISNDAEAVFDRGVVLEPLVAGMAPLQGATPGNVVTRFPPEPSGYLHIGHAKAVLMNEYYARRYKGRILVRFDDTNPSKEKEEFQSSILEDLKKINVQADVVTFTSDYFRTIHGYALYMIENGLAYMDDTPQEQMQKERLDRVNSKHRDQSPTDALKYFNEMCSGSEEGGKWCLRAKIDMQNDNGTLRDPVMFRQNLTPHHRSGTTFKAYPTYDMACPIVDSIEGVTHALRTTEYNDRDEQYQWIQSALGLRRVRIHAFARMNFMYTVLSKRNLTWFVDNKHVTGWDDPRFPTIRGVIRRGVNVSALRAFICSQGASRRIVNMEWGKFWAENKKEIDKTAKRFMAIDKLDHAKLIIHNAPSADDNAFITTDYLPKDPAYGKRVVRIAKEILLETVDIDGITVGEEIVLVRWGVVRITKVSDILEGEFIPDGDVKAAKRKLSWISNVKENITVSLMEFDNLIVKEKLEENENFKDFINPHTMATTEVVGDACLKTLKEHEIIQLERRGFYRVDRPYWNDRKGLILFMIPDGKAKAMSGLTGKLAHR